MALTACPECGYPLQGDEKKCPECGYQINNNQIYHSFEGNLGELTPCWECGHMLGSSATRCPICDGKTNLTCLGTLKIELKAKIFGKHMATTPLYVNGQLVDNVLRSDGGYVEIPINNPNITVGLRAPLMYSEHSYKLDPSEDYTLEIDSGIINLGQVLYDSIGNKLVKDKCNFGWVLFALLFSPVALLIGILWKNYRPIWSKCLMAWGLMPYSLTFIGLIPLLLVIGKNKPE